MIAENVVPLLIPTVCYLPDYELIQTDPQPSVSNTYNTSGFYLGVSNPSRCEGIADSIEACGELLRNDPNIIYYVFYVNFFRENGKSFYEPVGREFRFPLRGFDKSYDCLTRNLNLADEWTVNKGDVVGAEVLSECESNDCFLYAVFSPSMIVPNHTLNFVATTTISGLIPLGVVTTTPGFLNVRAHVGEPIHTVVYR